MIISKKDTTCGKSQGAPLDSPVHGNVCKDERGSEVKDLVAKSSPGVEDGCIERTRERTLSVGAEGIRDNTFLCLRACTGPISAQDLSL
jgi:hypothetical protein